MRHSTQVLTLVVIFALNPIDALGQVDDTKAIVDGLVEQLASPNPIPKEKKGSEADYPKSYDRKLQKPVYEAYRKLDQLGVKAFPFLIDHFDDKRYALTADVGSMDKNFSIGDVCYYIVELQIQPDKGFAIGEGDPRFRKMRPHYPRHIGLRNKEVATTWWERNKDRTLAEIQIVVTEWTIEEEEKSPEGYTDDERQFLLKRLQDLRNTNTPIPSPVPWHK